MAAVKVRARENQRRRTRKDLLEAAARLMKAGAAPSLEEIAAEALVSRATAYRYFPSLDALLIEAALDIASPEKETLFPENASKDPIARLERLDEAFDHMIAANEGPLRMMLAQSLTRGSANGEGDSLPARQNRRTPLIEAALEPAKARFKPADFEQLKMALALIIGTEGRIVAKDVLQLDDAAARRMKIWAIRALVRAALKEA
ncbi:MAG: TetR/AcrR family transcriptional regulator [Hyphomonadaceae bacterium]